jgi:hypothetical protein
MGRKTYVTTFLFAISLPIAIAVVSKSSGIHSTPGIGLMLAGLPGTMIGIWTGMAFADNGLLFYFATAVANWTFYLCVAKGMLWLRGKLAG